MPITPIRGTGARGINKDTSPVLLQTNEWSDGRNVRFHNGSAKKIEGHQSILTTEVQPIDLIYWDYDNAYIYADAENIYKVTADNTSTEVSKADHTYDSEGVWHSSLFNGGYTVIMNNTKEVPQYIQQGGNNFADLPNWDVDVTRVGILRPFANVLIAGNVTRGTNQEPGSILVSSQAAPGALPGSWEVGASLTTTADEFELSNTSPVTEIVDYRGNCFIFTEDSIHSLQLASGSTPTRVNNLNKGTGALATGCVVEFEGGLFAVGKSDIYVTSGAGSINSVSNHRMRDYFFENLSTTHYANTFVTLNNPQDEVWICFPNLNADTNGACNEALIWNYRDDTWTLRDLPNVFAATLGTLPEDGEFAKNKLYLTFNGYRYSDATQEQKVTMGGTQPNQVAKEQAVFNWVLSGQANTIVEGVSEVQTLTVSGDLTNTPAVVDVQSITLAGRSNAVGEDNTEIVDFGVDSDFDAGSTEVATYSISNTSESIPAITGSFSSGANATTARDDLKTALEADAEFNAAFEHDTDTEIAGSGVVTLDYKFSGTVNTVTTTDGSWFYTPLSEADRTSLRINHISGTVIDSIESLVDYLVSTYNAEIDDFKVGVASKVGTDTFRVTSAENERWAFNSVRGFEIVGISSFDVSVFGDDFTMKVSTSAFSDTDVVSASSNGEDCQIVYYISDENPPDTPFFGKVIGYKPVQVTRFQSRTDEDFENFTYTITANDGTNTNPYLNVVQHGSEGDIPASIYKVFDEDGSEITSFSSSVASVDSNDRSVVANQIESAIDSNTETPINYTASVSGDKVTITADEAGAAQGNWNVTVDHGSATGTNRGNMTATQANDTPGADIVVKSATIKITDPTEEYSDSDLIENSDSEAIAAVIRDYSITGWTLGGSGNQVTFTKDEVGSVTGLFAFTDSGDYADDVSGVFVETTAGGDEVPASSFSVTDSDGTVLISGTFVNNADSDTAGNFIASQPSLRCDVDYDTDSDRITLTYDVEDLRVRPTLDIDNPSGGGGSLAAVSEGADESGSDGTEPVSTYTIEMPSGFSPETVVVNAVNLTKSETLAAIRDGINNVSFTPSDINAAVVGDDLFLSWTNFTVEGLFSGEVDNNSGNGDITFGTPEDVTTDEASTEIHAADRGTTFNGESYESFVERKTMDVGDLEATKWSRSIYPLMSGSGQVTISVDGTNVAGKPVDLEESEAHTFDIDEDYKVDPRSNGRFFNIRIESTDNDEWTLDGYSITVDQGDRR